MTTEEIIKYYSSLLILQYQGKPKATATIEALVTGPVMDQLPTQVQNGFTVGDTTVAGTFYSGAVGAQLDILGKYVGVTRNGVDISGNPITLNDQQFTTLIKFGIISNGAGSSLSDIQNLIHMFFANEVFVYDGANMQMSYLVSSSVGDQALIEVLVTQGLFPKPMGVGLAEIIYIPSISLFGFQSYSTGVPPAWSSVTVYSLGQEVFVNGIVYASLVDGNLNNAVTDPAFWVALIYPFNSYVTYPVYEPYTWLSYQDGINVL
jgi:hypothetical protein